MSAAVGFIGLGVMGKPMALNLIKKGHPLLVHGRRAESMTPLIAAGARGCPSVCSAWARGGRMDNSCPRPGGARGFSPSPPGGKSHES